MQKIDEQKHFLALLSRPGDCIFISIPRLDIANGYSINTLQDIDIFTMKYSTEEIMASIKRANIAPERYLNGSLVIQDNQKHNPLQVIDKTFYNNFRIDLFLDSTLSDKNKLNVVINKFNALVSDEVIKKEFKESLNSGNLDKTVDILFNLPYKSLRKYMIYLIEYQAKIEEQKEKELIRDKAA
jgi:hypothetical protein